MKNIARKKDPTIKIRAAVPKDARGIRMVQYKTWLVTYPNKKAGITVDDIKDRYKDAFTPINIREREEKMKNKSPSERMFVAKKGEKVIGLCFITKGKKENELGAIYILPPFQGKGVGTLFWKWALRFFDPTKNTIVKVADYNVNAIAFYTKCGFKDTGKRWKDEKFKMKSGAMIPEMEMVIKAHRSQKTKRTAKK